MTGPIGTNLSAKLGENSGQPFLNILKLVWDVVGVTNQGRAYNNTDNIGMWNVDINGYPTSMVCNSGLGEAFSYFRKSVLLAMPYPSGPYVLSYKGGSAATHVSVENDGGGVNVGGANGRLVFNVASPGAGMEVRFGPVGSPAATDWSLVYSPGSTAGAKWAGGAAARPAHYGDEEWAMEHGDRVVTSIYKQRQSIYRSARFMWYWGGAGMQEAYDLSRFYSGPYLNWGHSMFVPIEVQVAMCNDIGWDMYIDTNPLMSFAAIEQAARLIHEGYTDNTGRVWPRLNPSLNLWVECGNEFWLMPIATGGAAEMWNVCSQRGAILNPAMQVVWTRAFNYAATVKAVQHNDLIRQIWTEYGDGARVKRVLAGQHADRGRNQGLMQQTSKLSDNNGTIGAGSGYTASFNASFSGTTMTVTSGVTGTIIAEQEVTASGIVPAVYVVSGSGTSWQLSRDISTFGPATLGSRAVTARYFTGQARDHFDYFATATYFDGQQSTDPNTFFANQQNMIDFDLIPNTQLTVNDCANPAYGNGLICIQYEGGQQNNVFGFPDQNFVRQMCLDPRMGQALSRLLNGLRAIGVDRYFHLQDIETPDQISPWGALRNVWETSSPRFDALSAYTDIGTAVFINVLPNFLPGGTTGTAYPTQTMTASGGTGPYTFTLFSGTLPNGLILASNGVLSGTPTVAAAFNFTIRATDNLGNQGNSPAYAVTIVSNVPVRTYHRVLVTVTP